MYSGRLLALLVVVVVVVVSADSNVARERVKRQPAQKDEALEEKTNRVDVADVELELQPSGQVGLLVGEDITFNCKVTNKPRNSQIQWYYMIRNKVNNTFDNFTILANEAATVNAQKYSVWTTPPNLYSLKINEVHTGDSGEYCCFLYVSYSETYREITEVEVKEKQAPTTTPYTPPRTTQRYNSGYGSHPSRGHRRYSPIDEIIEEAVEHDIELELGKKLNITLIKNNVKAQTLIHNATEEIKSLLNIKEDVAGGLLNGSAKLTITRKMQGASSQVKTVVTTLISRISNVDATLAKVLSPVKSGQADRSGGPSAGRQANGIPDWRRIYNEYKKSKANGAAKANSTAPRGSIYSSARKTTASPSGWGDSEELEVEHRPSNPSYRQPSSHGNSQLNQPNAGFQGKKCEYQLVINEFDPSQCPSLGSDRRTPAAMYYDSDDSKAAAFTPPVGNAQSPDNAQLSRIEDRLIEEMANSKMVNKTVLMHDSMLEKTEKMLVEQTGNITKLEELVKDLRTELAKSEEEKLDMENKVTNVMLNILEINKRLDVAMKRKGTPHFEKQVDVLSASENVACDKHPNVTHYKDCAEIADKVKGESGIYYIRPLYSACPVPVWCDMDTYPGGWTVIQRREGGSVNFNRNWESYRRGFGQVTGEHWLGNDNLFLLSNQAEYMLRTDMWDFFDSRVFAEYRSFKIDGERDGYRLTAANYSGTAGDGFKTHNKHKFSTNDRDNDMWQDYHCSYEWEGGWWFTNCWSSYLNGPYYNTSSPPYNGISWREWKEEQLFRSEMKIRPVYHVRNDAPTPSAAPADGSPADDQQVQGDQPRQSKVTRQKYNQSGRK